MKHRQTVAVLDGVPVYRRCKWYESDGSQMVWFWICLVAPIAAVALYMWLIAVS